MTGDSTSLGPVRSARGPFHPTWRLAIGTVIIGYGLLLMADNLRWGPAYRILDDWYAPCVVILFGLIGIVRACSTPSRILAGIAVIGGGLWLAENVAGIRIALFPLLLVAAGVWLIIRAREDRAVAGGPIETVPSQASGFAFWSGIHRRVASSAFANADFVAIMGGIEVDFRPATTAGGRAVVDVLVLMGGIDITVPPDWNVLNEAVVIMGGVDDRSSGSVNAPNTLVIRGFVLMGGVEVKT